MTRVFTTFSNFCIFITTIPYSALATLMRSQNNALVIPFVVDYILRNKNTNKTQQFFPIFCWLRYNDIGDKTMHLLNIYKAGCVFVGCLLIACTSRNTDCPQALSMPIKECKGKTIQESLQSGSDCEIAMRLNTFLTHRYLSLKLLRIRNTVVVVRYNLRLDYSAESRM